VTAKRNNMKSIIFSLIMAVFLIFSGCGQKPAREEAPEDVVNVTLEQVRLIDYTVPVKATGLLGTRTEMKLSFKTGGIIKRIYVREGDSVKRGSVLAELDLSEVKAQVKQADIGLEKAKRDLTRAENLYRDSVATLEQYQDVHSAYEMAKARKKVADFNLLHSRINAPAAGKVQKLLAEPNEMAAQGYPVLLFASTEEDWVVRAALTDKDVVRITAGDSARITMDAFPGESFLAMVSEVGTMADPFTGSYEVEMALYRPRPQFRTGFFSRVTIYPLSGETSLVVPVEALLDAQDNLAGIYVWEEGKCVRKRIKTGTVQQGSVVVLEGLKKGDLVVTDGARFIRKGTRVNPVNLNEVTPR
jgi:RND family efflux transporter MFP subunit